MTQDMSGGLSILLVDRNCEEREQVKQRLQSDSSWTGSIDFASTVQEALAKLKEKTFDLVLADSELQNDSGLRFLKEMHHLKIHLPFILMTSVLNDRLARQAIKAGVSELIVKNEEELKELTARVRECYERFHERGPKNSETGSIERPVILSNKDELTGLYNHSYLHERIVREFSKAVRYQYPLSCLMLDIDHFKFVNETHGYHAGDLLIQQVANLLFDHCRLSDLIARYGGEEFAILLPHIDYTGAVELARRLRLVFTEHPFFIEGKEINLTVSIGITSFPDDPIKMRGEILTFAMNALQHSKAVGRNRITLYRDTSPMRYEGVPEIKISEDKIVDFQRRMSESAEIARRSYIEASKTLIMALESKDTTTAGHAARCSKYAKQIAEAMGLSVDDAEIVEHAALLHDIGKICIPDEILLKPGRLTFAEFESMKQHCYMGYKILKPIKFLREEAQYVLHHHEWFNGEGYPCRLKGNDIPLGARIIAVIDSYDTMRNAGARYKEIVTIEKAVNELVACAGTQFDPEVVKAFVGVLKARGELKSQSVDEARLDQAVRDSKNPN